MTTYTNKPVAISVPGSVVTKATAPAYLRRIARNLLDNMSFESSCVLSDIEERIVAAGFLTWKECEQIEIEAL